MAEEISDLELPRLRPRTRASNTRINNQHAVCVIRNACKKFGTKAHPVNVLEDLSMTVPKGCIYGLLGASGCGKTTLINCIIGRNKLDSGEIWVLGGTPESEESGVPGPRIGYMPQEISLYGEFTIRETMKYFGWITGMTTEKIEERLQFLVKLLNLPRPTQMVGSLSGGEQRRVSLAVAFLHEPELLILDEPTVGLDPVLRETIWNFLLELTREKHVTVMLTTHYIDETKQASYIGLMRGGYLLDEETPQNLLDRCGTDTLEEAFFKLSVVQNTEDCRRSSIALEVSSVVDSPGGLVNQGASLDNGDIATANNIAEKLGKATSSTSKGKRISIASIASPMSKLPKIEPATIHKFKYLLNFKSNRIKALWWKNCLWFLRNPAILTSILVVPLVIVSLLCGCIGHNPTYLSIAVVNQETTNISCENVLSCNSTPLSCFYLQYLEKQSLNLIPYDSEIEARQSVLHGKTYASVFIKQNYTAALKNRFIYDEDDEEWDIVYSTIDVFRDISIRDIALFTKKYMYESLHSFLKDFLDSCGVNSKALAFPIKFEDPVFGRFSSEYTDFMAPGTVLISVFVAALGMTSMSMLAERKEGILERCLVVGVNPVEFLLSHIVCDSVLMVVQVALVLAFTFGIFGNTMVGSYLPLIVLTVLTGVCGISVGFAISSSCEDDNAGFMITSGIMLPIFIFSGMMWPIEGMHYILQYLAIILPITMPAEGARCIMQKGWGFSKPAVYEGIIILSVWIIIFLLVSVISLKFKSR